MKHAVYAMDTYAAGGDTYDYLRRSLATFREMERRLNEHPHWADLHFRSDTGH